MARVPTGDNKRYTVIEQAKRSMQPMMESGSSKGGVMRSRTKSHRELGHTPRLHRGDLVWDAGGKTYGPKRGSTTRRTQQYAKNKVRHR